MLMLGVKSLISFQQGSGEEFLELQQCWISMTISRLGPHAATSLNLSELEMLDRDVLATSLSGLHALPDSQHQWHQLILVLGFLFTKMINNLSCPYTEHIIALFPTKISCILADGFDDILFYVKTLKKLTTQGTSL